MSKATLAWTRNDETVERYEVLQGKEAGVYTDVIYTGAETQAEVDLDLSAGPVYLAVRAINDLTPDVALRSEFSSEVMVEGKPQAPAEFRLVSLVA